MGRAGPQTPQPGSGETGGKVETEARASQTMTAEPLRARDPARDSAQSGLKPNRK